MDAISCRAKLLYLKKGRVGLLKKMKSSIVSQLVVLGREISALSKGYLQQTEWKCSEWLLDFMTLWASYQPSSFNWRLYYNMYESNLWDAERSSHVKTRWFELIVELDAVDSIGIPRCITSEWETRAKGVNTRVLCDALNSAYRAVVYLITSPQEEHAAYQHRWP